MNLKNNSDSNRKTAILFIFMAIFLFKGIFYAVYLNPAAIHSSPDDVGHVSYIQYIYATKSLPVYGVPLENTTYHNYVDAGNDKDFKILNYEVSTEQFDQKNGVNWIVQHPPTYYLLMTPFYALGRLFTGNLAYLIIIMRLATLMLGVLSVFVVGKILDCAGAGRTAYICVLAAYVFYAPIQFFFSNITNDSLTILLCLVALLFLLRFVYGKRQRDFYFFAVSNGFIFMSKYTGALVIVAYLIFLLYKCLKEYNIKHTLSLFLHGILIAAIIDGPFLIRNYVLTGVFFPMEKDVKNYDYTFMQFLHCGYFNELFKNITAILGWKSFVQAGPFNLITLAVLLGVAFVMYLGSIKGKGKKIAIPLFSLFFLLFTPALRRYLGVDKIVCFIMGFAVSIMLIIIYQWVKDRDDKEKTIELFFIGTIALVFLFFFYKHYTIYNSRGHTGAMHGRYYYTAIFPMLYLIFNKLENVPSRVKRYIPSLVVLLMASNEFFLITECIKYF